MLKQKLSQAPKNKLSQTLRSWLPILQANIEDLKESLSEMTKDNPFVSVEQSKAYLYKGRKNYFNELSKNSISDTLEATSIAKTSVYENLSEQINTSSTLFPTQKSQDIALKILECLNSEG